MIRIGCFAEADFKPRNRDPFPGDILADLGEGSHRPSQDVGIEAGSRQLFDQFFRKREFVASPLDVKENGLLLWIGTPVFTESDHQRRFSHPSRRDEQDVREILQLPTESIQDFWTVEEVVPFGRAADDVSHD